MKNDTHNVSVIIPNYNNSKYLRRCIESVVKQTYKKIEIVVVDDCSTDDSKELLLEFKKEYSNIIVIFLEKNGGVSNARNVGFEHSSGEIVTFLDADDYYFNIKKIENEVQLILDCDEDIISYSLIKWVNEDESQSPIDLYRFKYVEGNIFFDMLKGEGKTIFLRDYCLKREMFEKSEKYDINSSFYEDFDLLLELAQKYKFYCTNEYGTAHRQGTAGLSTASTQKHLRKQQSIRKKYLVKLSWFKQMVIRVYWLMIGAYRVIKKIVRGT